MTARCSAKQTNSTRRPHLKRHQDLIAGSVADLMNRFPPGSARPEFVLNILISHFNHQHSRKDKDTSFKTRAERARYLRTFLHELQTEAGFKTLPDPRNIGQKHIQATVDIWKRRLLAPATIQTYLSFLRALCQWLRKPGLVRSPQFYGLTVLQYQRHEASNRDKSWSGNQINVNDLISAIDAYDAHVGAALRLICALGLRRKEAVMFNPHTSVIPFTSTGLPCTTKKADLYASILRGSKGGRQRFIPLDTPERLAAVENAKTVVRGNGDLTRPGMSLKQSLQRFSNVMKKFGLVRSVLGVTAHGLRHEVLLDEFERQAGRPAPVRGGASPAPLLDKMARSAVAEFAGHARIRASNAYCGSSRQSPSANLTSSGNDSAPASTTDA